MLFVYIHMHMPTHARKHSSMQSCIHTQAVRGESCEKFHALLHFMVNRLLTDWYPGVLNSTKFRMLVGQEVCCRGGG